jgi:arylsulfatase A-like enzyme
MRPNIVLILLDNFGYGEVGCYGGGVRRGAPTPRIDSLARCGMKLTNFNTEPVCTPSRSALLTGRFPIRSGTYRLANGPDEGLTQWEVTLANMLHDVGYTCAHFGKWHLGNRPGRYPTDQGFDEWYGIPRSNEECLWPGSPGYDPSELPPAHTLEGRAGEETREVAVYDLGMRSRFDGEITRRACDFIRRAAAAGQPFFAYLPMTTGHFPTIPSPAWAGRTGNGPWADVLAQLDDYIGQLLDTLDEASAADSTIVIFTADNGAESLYGLSSTTPGVNRGWPGPWRGSYGTAMEGGLRVPFLVRWPGMVPEGVESDAMVHLVDVFPTIARIVGATVPADRMIDGIDHLDLLLGTHSTASRDFIPVYDWWQGNLLAAKWRHWKVHFAEKERIEDPPVQRTRLVNLLIDPMEEEYLPGISTTWVWNAIQTRIAAFEASFAIDPPIAPQTPDPYLPSRSAEVING